MAKNDQQEAYEKLMSANHGRMIDFVKFAETKNAALLTFASVWIGAIINLLKSPDELPFNYGKALVAALILLFFAAAICLTSLLPRFLDQVYKREDERVNLLYFGDIVKGGVKDYPEMAEKEYRPQDEDSTTPTYLRDLAVQTAIQASIAHRKFRFFHRAGSLVLLAFLVMLLPPVIAAARWAFSQFPC
ncbi:hypothetical protein ELI13_36025 [Rhizobium ruizarguesonis]|uniref:Pycsar effector protein domain-containing protein n=1 Tax=Rhizobium ruizarguesonis TaxID=2081791 RepID=A0ABY1WWF4_9HYPH|nr:Pycsar system effector family protein [Rhizobium ruizarguesonis]TAU13114.1 hypothetical protein ELI48_37785 [Rhizobium ruizarguesonis]TAU57017.1 hypothetical protein ELI45_38140 [Rhizobium ruizarguesonis]TAV18847.1 hypothetical protein ELI36_38315 [Rhizobium ruizarguesonis]TAV18891.1 hypothetical protein ELI36_38250 [Rhizobium ruizarguesonis]TAW01861.1 hypothetical protein ELI26_38905 [Rhizobium ruizarguesonis]